MSRPWQFIQEEDEPDAGLILLSRPRGAVFAEYSQTYQDGFRVADASLDRYELFVGEDAPPDFEASGQPVATSPTLPFNWTPTPPGVGTKVLHIVVRKRNAYDLSSFNVYETLLEINPSSVEQLGPVSAPFNTKVYDGASGYIRVVSKYVNTEDRNPADKWEVYVGIGAAHTPGVDTPAYTADMEFLGVEAGLVAVLGPYAPGAVAYVTVAAKRNSDSERGTETVNHTLAESVDLEEGLMFGGESYEQR